MEDNIILDLLANQIQSIKTLIDSVSDKNSQRFLDLLDELNKVSVSW